MPSNEEHAQHCYKLTGHYLRELHRWMDEPAQTYGPNHRIFRHDPENPPKDDPTYKRLVARYGFELIRAGMRAHALLDDERSGTASVWLPGGGVQIILKGVPPDLVGKVREALSTGNWDRLRELQEEIDRRISREREDDWQEIIHKFPITRKLVVTWWVWMFLFLILASFYFSGLFYDIWVPMVVWFVGFFPLSIAIPIAHYFEKGKSRPSEHLYKQRIKEDEPTDDEEELEEAEVLLYYDEEEEELI